MSNAILPDPDRSHRYSLMINWSDTNNAYIVCIPELQGAKTHGDTLQEAIEMAKDLIACYADAPSVLNPLPEPLLFDDRTNFAPNPFDRIAGLGEDVERFARRSDEEAMSASDRLKVEPAHV